MTSLRVIHVRCGDSLSLEDWLVLDCVSTACFLCAFICRCTVGLLPVLAVVSDADVSVGAHSLWACPQNWGCWTPCRSSALVCESLRVLAVAAALFYSPASAAQGLHFSTPPRGSVPEVPAGQDTWSAVSVLLRSMVLPSPAGLSIGSSPRCIERASPQSPTPALWRFVGATPPSASLPVPVPRHPSSTLLLTPITALGLFCDELLQ